MASPTTAPRPPVRVLALVSLVFAASLTDAQVEAINQPGWRFTGWDGLAGGNGTVVRKRSTARLRMTASVTLTGQWMGGLTQAEHDLLVKELVTRWPWKLLLHLLRAITPPVD